MKDRLVQMLKEGNFVGSGESVLGKAKYVEALQDMPFVKLLSEPVCVVASEKMKNARISGCLHVTPQTSVLINALASILGVQLRWSACNMESTSDDIAQFMVENGFAVFAKRNETIEEYWLCIASPISNPLNPEVVTPSVGHSPKTNTKVAFSLKIPLNSSVKTLFLNIFSSPLIFVILR